MAIQIDGLLIVDKPEGITSLEAVREVKRRFHVKKAGHIGTLDPFATGVLPIAINEGTKLVPFLEEEPKEYEGVMKLGEETSTDDLTGEITSKKPWEDIPPGLIYSVFHTFLGKVQQIPPMFSAVKIQGKPLYRLARKGIEIERKERSVEIFDIQVEEIDLPLGPLQGLLLERNLHPNPGKGYRKEDGIWCSPYQPQTASKWTLHYKTGDLMENLETSLQVRRTFTLVDFFKGGLTKLPRGDRR